MGLQCHLQLSTNNALLMEGTDWRLHFLLLSVRSTGAEEHWWVNGSRQRCITDILLTAMHSGIAGMRIKGETEDEKEGEWRRLSDVWYCWYVKDADVTKWIWVNKKQGNKATDTKRRTRLTVALNDSLLQPLINNDLNIQINKPEFWREANDLLQH